ncbi:O-antigen ligase family protein [Microbacterium ureisolvens]|uniref:O-antigen ligase family protein n=1 Tax=Microbacterium ureisolvens TaxID=2781186 RepID=UPI00362CF549
MKSGSASRDFLLRTATPFLMGGMFFTPMLVLRIGGFTVGDVLFFVASGLVLLSTAPRPPRQPAIQVALLLGLIGSALVLAQTPNIAESTMVSIRVLFVWSIWQFAVRKWAEHPQQLSVLVTCFAVGAAASGAVAIGQAYLGLSVPGTEIVHGRVPGLATHVNGQGGALAVATAMTVGLLLARVRARLHLACLVLIVIGLLLSGSVTGMLAAIVGTFVVMIAQKASLGRLFAILGTAALAVLAALNLQTLVPGASSPLDRFLDTTGQSDSEGTLASRVATYIWTWERIVASPLVGVGLDANSGGTFDGQTQVHNMLLLVWFQGGLLLLTAVLVVIAYTVSAFAKMPPNTLKAPLLGAFAGALTFAMTGPVLYDRWFWLPFVLAWALPVAIQRDVDHQVHPNAKAIVTPQT